MQQQVETAKFLGEKSQLLITQLGEPLQKLDTPNGFKIFVYNTAPGVLADYYYLNNDEVVFISLSFTNKNTILGDLATNSYNPKIGYLLAPKVSENEKYHRPEFFFSNLEDGVGYLVLENSLNGQVKRVYYFDSNMSESELKEVWGDAKNIRESEVTLSGMKPVERQKVTISINQATSSSKLPAEDISSFVNNGVFLGFFFLVMTLLIVLVYKFRHLFKKKNITTDEPQP